MLKDLKNPEQLKSMNLRQMEELAQEIRTELIQTVSENGGHLASNLGIVELTIAIHYVFNCPEDKIVFDVGHQCYVHKLLTGRAEAFHTLRQKDGISGFPAPEESEYDTFVAGHASTAISAALGMARTRAIMHSDERVIAVVGDGALTGGMCYEALNDAGQSKTPLIVILNDNEMSISRNVGALSQYLNGLRQSRGYRSFKRGVRRTLERIPHIGVKLFRFIEKLKDMVKSLFIDGKFFEALGFVYIGPIDGHDLKHMIRILRRARDDKRPLLIHMITQKGRGYQPAESHPDEFHGVAPFFVESGKSRPHDQETSCGKLIAHQLSEIADQDIRICAISAAMVAGTGMEEFQKRHPDRFFDVGIAEEHAVTMAAGMAASGMKPYVALYSSFLQRSYDQIMIDVCRNNLPVTFLIDRAGFAGADGKTHQGLYDLSFLRSIPNIVIAAPRDVRDLKKMIDLSVELQQPMAIRYPKTGLDLGPGLASQQDIKAGEWELLSDGDDVMIFAEGPMVQIAMQTAVELNGKRIAAGVVDARFLKPMDAKMALKYGKKARLVVTLEENTVCGGLGEGIAHIFVQNDVHTPMLILGAQDCFVAHARVSEQRAACGMSVSAICDQIQNKLNAKNGGGI